MSENILEKLKWRDATKAYNPAKKAVNGGYVETWNSRQAYIALGFLLETAALLGVDATR